MKIETLDDQIVLSCAFRYALGRRTYVVDTVVKAILENWEVLPRTDKARYKKEIIESESLGDKCNAKNWHRILKEKL